MQSALSPYALKVGCAGLCFLILFAAAPASAAIPESKRSGEVPAVSGVGTAADRDRRLAEKQLAAGRPGDDPHLQG